MTHSPPTRRSHSDSTTQSARHRAGGPRHRPHLPQRCSGEGPPPAPPQGEGGGDLEPPPTLAAEESQTRQVSPISRSRSVAHQVELDISLPPQILTTLNRAS